MKTPHIAVRYAILQNLIMFSCMVEIEEVFKYKLSTIDDIINILTKVFDDDKDKFVGRILRARYFLDNRFHNIFTGDNANNLSFYAEIKPYIRQWSLLYQLWNEINIELEEHHDYLKNLSKKELICFLGAYAEIINAEKKINESSPEFISMEETDRQAYYASITGIVIKKILNDFFPHKSENVKEINEELFNYNKINSIIKAYNKYDQIDYTIYLHIYENYNVEIINNIIKVSPTNIEYKNNFLDQKKSFLKSKCDYQYHQNFVNHCLGIESIPKFDCEKFEGYISENNSININFENIKVLCNEESSNYQNEYLTELMLLSSYSLTDKNDFDIVIELKNKTSINLSELVKIGLVFKFISKLYIYQIDKELKEKQNYFFALLQKDNSFYWYHNQKMNFMLKNFNANAEYDYLRNINNKTEQQELEQLIIETKVKIFNSIEVSKTVVSFKKEDLIDLISYGLKKDKKVVSFLIELLTSVNAGTNLNFQPILSIDETLFWYPNLLAYTSISELIFESLLEKGTIELSNIQSDISEEILSKSLERAGFKIINDKKDKSFIDFEGKNGDFDALAYKNGTLLHFELKQSHKRNDPKKLKLLKSDFDKKGKNQIPRIQKYIIDSTKNKERFIKDKKIKNIREILQLSENEEIKNIKSYLISNNFDFDRQEFNGFRKINILELIVLLTDTEFFLHDFEDYLKINIKRINKAGKPTPKIFLSWANREISNEDFVKNEKNLIMANRFVEYFKKPYWKNKNDKTIEELIDNIENNRVFDYLEDLNNVENFKTNGIPFGKYILQID